MKDKFTSLEIKCIRSRHRLAPFIYVGARSPRLYQLQMQQQGAGSDPSTPPGPNLSSGIQSHNEPPLDIRR